MLLEENVIFLDVLSALIVGLIFGIVTYLANNWRKNKNHNQMQNIKDNRFKEALLTLAEVFDDETRRLHPNDAIPLIKPKIERLVANGAVSF